MLKNIIFRVLGRRHFWREVGFDELSELYVSVMLRTFAISLLMVFVPFYLFRNGYPLYEIFLIYAAFFITKCFTDIAAGFTVARFGPKHTMIVSCVLQIVTAMILLSVPDFHWSFWIIGAPWGASASFYFIAYHVEFSKIRHSAHAGKELGYMHMVEKLGAIAGPLLGGLAGTFFGAQYIFIIAVIVLLISLVPLFQSAEPVKTRQKLRFSDLNVSTIKQDLVPYASMGIENTLCINLWPLYLALFALGQQVYAKLGALSAIAVAISIGSAYLAGKFIDHKNARSLLRTAAIGNALLYLFRPFVGSIQPALAVNTANELLTTGYRMPVLKGVYAAADDLPGFRIVYLVTLEMIGEAAKASVWLLLAILAVFLSAKEVLIVGFAIASVASLLIMTERFKALNPRKI